MKSRKHVTLHITCGIFYSRKESKKPNAGMYCTEKGKKIQNPNYSKLRLLLVFFLFLITYKLTEQKNAHKTRCSRTRSIQWANYFKVIEEGRRKLNPFLGNKSRPLLITGLLVSNKDRNVIETMTLNKCRISAIHLDYKPRLPLRTRNSG